MDEQTPIIECIFCGTPLTPELAARFLQEDRPDELDPEASERPPICSECQAGIDENQRDRQAEVDQRNATKVAFELKLLFGVFVVATLCVVLEAVLRTLFGPRRG